MMAIILLLFVAVLILDPKSLAGLAVKAGALYGKLQHVKQDVLGELQSAASELAGPSGSHTEGRAAPQGAGRKGWGMEKVDPETALSDQGMAARIEELCSETVVVRTATTEFATPGSAAGLGQVTNV